MARTSARPANTGPRRFEARRVDRTKAGLGASLSAIAAAGLLWLTQPAVAQPPPAPWPGALQPNGWTEIGGDNSEWGFYALEATVTAGALPRLWARLEYSSPQPSAPYSGSPTFRSDLELAEFDCSRGRERLLQQILYQYNNVGGVVVSSSRVPSPWSYATPGTFAGILEQIACGMPLTR